MADRRVRVRFAPSPTGDLHVGNVRTALFNWAYARRHGGRLVFRLEDTDRVRSTDEACEAAIDVLRWLGLDWDEGPEVGGPNAPYRQSERGEIYTAAMEQLAGSGATYACFCTAEEVSARNAAAGRPDGYDNFCRTLTAADREQFVARGRHPVIRLRMPDGVTEFDDLVRGPVSFDNATVPDYVLVRADGAPLYTLAAAVDDVQMGITDIIRGEDLLSSTPRQIALYRALGVPDDAIPRFGHLPMVLGPDGARLSKRNGVVSIAWYRHEGFLPEALVNYLALLGWSPGDDREDLSLADIAAEFDVSRVNKSPAQFDVGKLEAINGDKIRALSVEDFADRATEFLQQDALVATPPTEAEQRLIDGVGPLVQTRVAKLSEIPNLVRFLFVDDDHFHIDPAAAASVLMSEHAPGVLREARTALEALDEFTDESVQQALRTALVDGLGIKPRHAFTPVRVAVTGGTVSPPLFESIVLLGRDATIARLHAALGS